MLKKFECNNSYCYKDRVALDMSAERITVADEVVTKIPELFDEVVRDPGGSRFILPVAAIYGKNASGKTKLIQSLRDMAVDALGDSFSSALAFSNLSPFEQIVENRQFIFCEAPKTEISYFICVVIKTTDDFQGAEYQLKYSIGYEGIKEESVTIRGLGIDDEPTPLYTREGNKLIVCNDKPIRGNLKIMEAQGNKRLWFSQIAPSHDGLDRLYEWFRYVRDGLTLNTTSNQERVFSGIAERIANKKDESFRNRLLCFLKLLDFSISDIKGVQYGDRYHLLVYHRQNDSQNSSNAHRITNESGGTRELIQKFELIDRSLTFGMPMICDELDKMLHPVVFKRIVEMFNFKDFNPRDAQLIFSAHDTIVLDSDLLRRDEVHIVDKDEFAAATIKRLSDYSEVGEYPRMESEFRTGWYQSFPGDLRKTYEEKEDGSSKDA